jgi:hypothetical protein
MDAKLDVMPPDLLNPAQRSSLTVVLRAFEMHLRQIDVWLQGREERGILYRRSLNLPPALRAVAREQITEALAQIAVLVERFGLTATEDDLGPAIASLMSVDWANLCDTRSEKLRRYGEVDPCLADLLDADLDRLAQLALSLAALGQDVQTP